MLILLSGDFNCLSSFRMYFRGTVFVLFCFNEVPQRSAFILFFKLASRVTPGLRRGYFLGTAMDAVCSAQPPLTLSTLRQTWSMDGLADVNLFFSFF